MAVIIRMRFSIACTSGILPSARASAQTFVPPYVAVDCERLHLIMDNIDHDTQRAHQR